MHFFNSKKLIHFSNLEPESPSFTEQAPISGLSEFISIGEQTTISIAGEAFATISEESPSLYSSNTFAEPALSSTLPEAITVAESAPSPKSTEDITISEQTPRSITTEAFAMVAEQTPNSISSNTFVEPAPSSTLQETITVAVPAPSSSSFEPITFSEQTTYSTIPETINTIGGELTSSSSSEHFSIAAPPGSQTAIPLQETTEITIETEGN